jgi:hypothetical protein
MEKGSLCRGKNFFMRCFYKGVDPMGHTCSTLFSIPEGI